MDGKEFRICLYTKPVGKDCESNSGELDGEYA